MTLKEWVMTTPHTWGEVAVMLGIEYSYLYRIRKGISNPSRRLVHKIKDLSNQKVDKVQDGD